MTRTDLGLCTIVDGAIVPEATTPQPLAYLHTLHMEGEQTYKRLSFEADPEDVWGEPGKDYSEEYPVSVVPLVDGSKSALTPSQPDDYYATMAGLSGAEDGFAVPTLQPAERERVARTICYWSPGTCHDAYCIGECRAVVPEKWCWRAADALLSTPSQPVGEDVRHDDGFVAKKIQRLEAEVEEWKRRATASIDLDVDMQAREIARLTSGRDSWRRVAERVKTERQALISDLAEANRLRAAAEARADELTRQLEEAREALKPFAEAEDGISMNLRFQAADDHVVYHESGNRDVFLRMGHFRRARSILPKDPK